MNKSISNNDLMSIDFEELIKSKEYNEFLKSKSNSGILKENSYKNLIKELIRKSEEEMKKYKESGEWEQIKHEIEAIIDRDK